MTNQTITTSTEAVYLKRIRAAEARGDHKAAVDLRGRLEQFRRMRQQVRREMGEE